MLFRLVIALLPRSKHLLILWLQSPLAVILELKYIKSVTVSIVSPSICHEVMEPDAITFIFWTLRFKPASSLSLFTLIKRLVRSSLLAAMRVVSSAYLKLLILLPGILIPACDSSSLVFHMMYSAYKLNKQGDSIQPWCTPFPILNQSFVPSLFLTVASCPTYRFIRRQVRWSGIPISLRIFHSLLWSTQSKAFSIVNEAEVDIFPEFPCFFYDPAYVGNLISGSSAFSKRKKFTLSENISVCAFKKSLILTIITTLVIIQQN